MLLLWLLLQGITCTFKLSVAQANPSTSSDHYIFGKQTKIYQSLSSTMILVGRCEEFFLTSKGFSLVLYILTMSENMAKYRVFLPMFLMPCCSCDSV